MQAYEKAFAALADRYRLFVGTPGERALHVLADAQLLPPAAGLLAALESKAENRHPVFVSVVAARGDDHWRARARELRNEYEDLRTSASEAGVEMPAIAEPPDDLSPLAACAVVLARAATSTRAPLAAPIVLLVPSSHADERFAEDLATLLRAPGLEAIRWIVLEPRPTCRAAITACPGGVAHECRIDASDLAADLSALAAVAQRAAATSNPGGAHIGGAGPGVAPPRRAHEPAVRAPSPAELASMGVAPARVDPVVGAKMRAGVMQGVAAAARGDGAGAIRGYRDARDVAASAGLDSEAVTFEMMMAAAALASAPAAAIATFESARERALRAGLGELAGRAQMGLAAALLSQGREADAVDAYRRAVALCAEAAPALAIEALRMEGTLHARARREEEAAAAWRRALVLARAADEDIARASSAPLVARALAELCRRHGLTPQANSLEAEAARLEATPADAASQSALFARASAPTRSN